MSRCLYTIAAVLALVSQLGLVLVSCDEENGGRSTASHVENGGASHHFYSHDETHCAACQAQSVHGTPSRATEPLAVCHRPPRVANTVVVRAPLRLAAAASNPRAPPVVS